MALACQQTVTHTYKMACFLSKMEAYLSLKQLPLLVYIRETLFEVVLGFPNTSGIGVLIPLKLNRLCMPKPLGVL